MASSIGVDFLDFCFCSFKLVWSIGIEKYRFKLMTWGYVSAIRS